MFWKWYRKIVQVWLLPTSVNSKIIKNYEKSLEDSKKESIEALQLKENLIKKLEQDIVDLQRKNESFDKENRRLGDNINTLKGKIEALEEKSLDMQKEFELNLLQREKDLSNERIELENEIRSLKEELVP